MTSLTTCPATYSRTRRLTSSPAPTRRAQRGPPASGGPLLVVTGFLPPGPRLAGRGGFSSGNPTDGGSRTFEGFAVARLPAVLRFGGVLTGDRALAEDVVQEVLVRAYLRWEHIARMSLPELYVKKMVVNEFLSWRRRSWRTVPAGP